MKYGKSKLESQEWEEILAKSIWEFLLAFTTILNSQKKAMTMPHFIYFFHKKTNVYYNSTSMCVKMNYLIYVFQILT